MKNRQEIKTYLGKERKNFDFDFEFNLQRDARYLDWIFRQFITGEMTGLKEGSALQKAPDLDAADFLARQVRDEIKHARLYQNMVSSLRQTYQFKPAKTPTLLNSLVQPISGRLWQEHCFLDKNIGEAWVLQLMLAMMNSVKSKRYVQTLESIAVDEVTHIQFGREQTLRYSQKAFYRVYLAGLYLRNRLAMILFSKIVLRHFRKSQRKDMVSFTEKFFEKSLGQLDAETFQLLHMKKPAGLKAALLICFSQLTMMLRLLFFGWGRRPALAD